MLQSRSGVCSLVAIALACTLAGEAGAACTASVGTSADTGSADNTNSTTVETGTFTPSSGDDRILIAVVMAFGTSDVSSVTWTGSSGGTFTEIAHYNVSAGGADAVAGIYWIVNPTVESGKCKATFSGSMNESRMYCVSLTGMDSAAPAASEKVAGGDSSNSTIQLTTSGTPATGSFLIGGVAYANNSNLGADFDVDLSTNFNDGGSGSSGWQQQGTTSGTSGVISFGWNDTIAVGEWALVGAAFDCKEANTPTPTGPTATPTPTPYPTCYVADVQHSTEGGASSSITNYAPASCAVGHLRKLVVLAEMMSTSVGVELISRSGDTFTLDLQQAGGTASKDPWVAAYVVDDPGGSAATLEVDWSLGDTPTLARFSAFTVCGAEPGLSSDSDKVGGSQSTSDIDLSVDVAAAGACVLSALAASNDSVDGPCNYTNNALGNDDCADNSGDNGEMTSAWDTSGAGTGIDVGYTNSLSTERAALAVVFEGQGPPTPTPTNTGTPTHTPTPTPTFTPPAILDDRNGDGVIVFAIEGDGRLVSDWVLGELRDNLHEADVICEVAESGRFPVEAANDADTTAGTCDVGAATYHLYPGGTPTPGASPTGTITPPAIDFYVRPLTGAEAFAAIPHGPKYGVCRNPGESDDGDPCRVDIIRGLFDSDDATPVPETNRRCRFPAGDLGDACDLVSSFCGTQTAPDATSERVSYCRPNIYGPSDGKEIVGCDGLCEIGEPTSKARHNILAQLAADSTASRGTVLVLGPDVAYYSSDPADPTALDIDAQPSGTVPLSAAAQWERAFDPLGQLRGWALLAAAQLPTPVAVLDMQRACALEFNGLAYKCLGDYGRLSRVAAEGSCTCVDNADCGAGGTCHATLYYCTAGTRSTCTADAECVGSSSMPRPGRPWCVTKAGERLFAERLEQCLEVFENGGDPTLASSGQMQCDRLPTTPGFGGWPTVTPTPPPPTPTPSPGTPTGKPTAAPTMDPSKQCNPPAQDGDAFYRVGRAIGNKCLKQGEGSNCNLTIGVSVTGKIPDEPDAVYGQVQLSRTVGHDITTENMAKRYHHFEMNKVIQRNVGSGDCTWPDDRDAVVNHTLRAAYDMGADVSPPDPWSPVYGVEAGARFEYLVGSDKNPHAYGYVYWVIEEFINPVFDYAVTYLNTFDPPGPLTNVTDDCKGAVLEYFSDAMGTTWLSHQDGGPCVGCDATNFRESPDVISLCERGYFRSSVANNCDNGLTPHPGADPVEIPSTDTGEWPFYAARHLCEFAMVQTMPLAQGFRVAGATPLLPTFTPTPSPTPTP